MSLSPNTYDRSPLSVDERQALREYAAAPPCSADRRRVVASLDRLIAPIVDVTRLRFPYDESPYYRHMDVTRKLFLAMDERGASFWQWSDDDWVRILTTRNISGSTMLKRATLIDIAYLLCAFDRWTEIGSLKWAPMAHVIFGETLVREQAQWLGSVLYGTEGMGFSDGGIPQEHLHNALCRLLIYNRTPYIDALTRDLVERVALDFRSGNNGLAGLLSNRMSLALAKLGILAPIMEEQDHEGRHDGEGVPALWYEWAQSWKERSAVDLRPVQQNKYMGHICMAGRWLASTHPEITSPDQWTDDIALSYRSDLFKETIGQYAGPHALHRMGPRGIIGKMVSYSGIRSRLTVMRRFFNDLQKRPHSVHGEDARTIPLRFKPDDALETPAVVDKAIAAMTPRDIDLLVWQKLAGAAATLTKEDVAGSKHPLSLYRALALLWISTARRKDELMRLRLECVRPDHSVEMKDEDGVPLESGEQALESEKGRQIWYLHIPTNKYGGEFWIWIPPYVATAIDEWKKERGKCNPATWDAKDREYADLLFVQRGQPINSEFLNRQLIPLLCRKAGVPLSDAKGAYTSHRGRSTRLTLLHLCGMSLEDLAEYAGHNGTATIKRYVRSFPIHLHRKVAQADTLSREIEGLIDLDAAAQGKPALRWFLGYNPEGKPSFCGLPAHQTCPHRLDCPHCGLHIGGEDAQLLCESDHVQPIWTRIPVLEPERLLSEGQVKAAEEALGQLSATPTPVPPSAAFLTNPAGLSEDRMRELATLGTSDARLQLTMVRDDCQARLAGQQGKDRRNALVRGLRNRFAFAEKCLEECRCRDAVPA